MVDNQHKKIIGYRDLTEDEIAKMNDVKQLGEQIGYLIADLRLQTELDQRWVSIGATDLQTGLMALVRSITRPTTF